MKRLLLFVVLGGLALSSAASDPVSSSVEVRGSQFQLPAKPYPMWPEDVQSFAGAYTLSNGETMVLRREGRRLYGAIGKRAPRELIAASPNEFVARDRQLMMTFDEDQMGDKTFDMLMIVPRTLSDTGPDMDSYVRLSSR